MSRLLMNMKTALGNPAELQSSQSIKRFRLLRLLLIVVLSFYSYLFFSRLVVTAVEVRGTSMAPTLIPGERMMLNRFAYLHRSPARGELVVLKDPETGDLVVKRIVGMPGELIEVDVDNAFINGRRLSEPYLQLTAKAPLGQRSRPIVIPQNFYYVLGDNRHDSVDSRVFGPVPRENIVGVINL